MQKQSARRPRIGLFTDTYRPTINGISVVVDTYRRQMERAGWEVFIICPATRSARPYLKDDDHIILMPSIKGWPYKEYDVSFFWPPTKVRALQAYNFDAVIFFSPGQLGLLACSVARRSNCPVIAQHSTDILEYIQYYHGGILAGILQLLSLPFAVRLSKKDWRDWLAGWRVRRGAVAWTQQLVASGVAILYRHCNGVVALSRKTEKQLSKMPNATWQTAVIPTGVDPFPQASSQAAMAFRKQWNIALGDTVLLYAGRIGAEKNLDVLISMLEKICDVQPSTKLVFAGDFDYRPALETKAQRSKVASSIVFVGKIPRTELNAVYASADVFVFPSKTDTQGLVLHEAACAGLPIVACDPDVSEVVRHDVNGYIVDSTPSALAHAVLHIVKDPRRLRAFRMQSKTLGGRYSEERQAATLLLWLQGIIAQKRHPSASDHSTAP